jgi:Flp pilus assembly protein TadD
VVALRQRSSARIALGFSFVLLLFTAILLLGGQTLERFNFHQPGGTGLTADFRWKIFHDAFDLIRASPWCGVGLGNFESIFAIFRHESLTQTRALHPESDWIWLWAELGWPALLVTILGAILLIRHVLPLQEGTNQRFRLAALLASVIFAVHGIVDVSAHRVGTAYAALFLLGMALHRPQTFKRRIIVSIFFRLLGLALVVSGIAWAMAAKKNQLLPGSPGVSSVKQLSPVSMRGRNYEEAMDLNSRALEWAPLDWQLYFARALAEIGARKPDMALDDFRRARFLEPNSFEVPMAEGTAWLASQPIYAATAWREALRRTTTGAQRLEVYGNMFSKAAVENPEVGRILQDVGVTQHDLVLAYLSRVSGPRFNEELKRFLKTDPDLHTLTDPEKLALFSLWSERGDLNELVRQVQEHRDWMPYAWFGVAKQNAAKRDFQAAYQLTEKFGDAVAMPRLNENASLEQLQNRYFANPDNYATGYALYREQMQRGRVDDALLTARHFSERSNAPAYFHFLEARAWAGKQNWERAWNAWLAYRDASAKK